MLYEVITGSIFKTPPGQAAWRLIRDAGLAGARHGAAEISAKHANFIVNLGGARVGDVADEQREHP